MSTKTMYNSLSKILSAQTHPIGAFTQHAQRYSKTTNLLRRDTSHTLRWDVSNPMVLQKTRSQKALTELYKVSSKKQSLHNGRTNSISSLYYNCWSWTIKFYQNIAIQWLIPKYSRFKVISQCNNTATFYPSAYTSSSMPDYCGSQSYPATGPCLFQDANKYHFRFGFYHNNCIWPFGEGNHWLQSTQAQKTLLSPPALLREPYPRLYSWCISFWRQPLRFRKSEFLKRMLNQITTLYISDKSSRRCQLLCKRFYRVSRRRTNGLCHCSQAHSGYPTQTCRCKVPHLLPRLAGRRISLSAMDLAKTASLYCSTPAHNRRTYSPANTFYSAQVCLPCVNYQFAIKSRVSMAILQRACSSRIKYQRTKVGLFSSQNTYKEILSKRDLFSSAFIRLQYRQLVQTAVSASRISVNYITNLPHRILDVASKISKNRASKFTQIASTLCLQLGI